MKDKMMEPEVKIDNGELATLYDSGGFYSSRRCYFKKLIYNGP